MKVTRAYWGRTFVAVSLLAALLGCQAVQGNQPAPPPPTPSGSVTVANSSLNFGTLAVGQSASLSDSVANGTSTTVTIAQPSITGTGFSITSPAFPLTIAAGQRAAMQLMFNPSSSGAHNGTLTFTAGSQTFAISLSGTANSGGTLSGSPGSLTFGNVQVGNTASITETVTNTGTSSVTISQANLSGTGFTISGLALPTTLNANQSATVSVMFSPTSAGTASGNLAIVSTASNSTLNVGLSATAVTPGSVSATPATLSFGSVATGSSKSLSEKLTNSGGSAITISTIVPSGAGFSISGVNPPTTLSPGQSVTFNVTFAPSSTGAASGSLAVASNAANPSLSVSLSGSGTAPGQLALSPSALTFGNVVVGTTGSQTGTLTATGASVTISSITGTNSEFSISGLSLPLTIAPGGSASFTAIFSPTATGSASGTLNFSSNATNTPSSLAVSGSGTPPPQHSVTLNWNPSSSSNVLGYNVYRGAQSGGPYSKLNSALDVNTTDSDLTVLGGQTYYYVVTAVDSNGLESGYSNQVQAVIPFP